MFKSTMLILAVVMVCFTFTVVESDGKKPPKPPDLTINAPSEYQDFYGYTISAEVYSDNEISHVIFITPSGNSDSPTKSFLFAVPPYTITDPYSADAISDSFDVYVIATDITGKATKDFVTITRAPNPPDLKGGGLGLSGGYVDFIQIENLGETATEDSGFYVDLYESPPEIGQMSTFCRIFVDRSIAPGERINLSVDTCPPIPFHNEDCRFWVQLDTDGHIVEFDETNNILDWRCCL